MCSFYEIEISQRKMFLFLLVFKGRFHTGIILPDIIRNHIELIFTATPHDELRPITNIK